MMLGSLGVIGGGVVPSPSSNSGGVCSWFFHGFPWEYSLCGGVNSNVATPPTPPVDMWTKAPMDQAQADAIVQEISNQTVARQQAIDGSLITPVSAWGVPSSLIPDSAGSDDTIPWMVYGVLGIAVVGLVMSGGRRR